MGSYRNGGNNEVGLAVADSFVGVWTVDTPNIDVIDRAFYDQHDTEIYEAARLGQGFSDSSGQTGAVAVIGTDGDLDEEGHPKEFDTASEYVAHELDQWLQDNGADYERAIAQGYSR